MAYAPVNGTQIYYRTYGQGLPMVLVHGNGSNHLTWVYQTTYFSRWYRTITPDLRGFGNTVDVHNGPYVTAATDDFVGLLDHLGIDRAIVVAHSLGGRLMLPAAVQHPDRLLALVMIGSSGGLEMPGPFNDGYSESRKAINTLPTNHRYLSPSFVHRNPALSQVHMELATLDVGNPRRRSGFPPLPKVLPADLQKLAHLPVQWVVGEADPWNPAHLIEMAHQQTPDSEYVLVPNAGHSPYWELPEAFNQVLLDFLTRRGLGPSSD